MRLEKFTIKAQEALAAARDLASERNHQEVTPEHVLRALLVRGARGWSARCCASWASIPRRSRARSEQALEQQPQVRGATAEVYVGRRLKEFLEEATRQSQEFKDDYVSSEHLLLALVGKDLGAASRVLARGRGHPRRPAAGADRGARLAAGDRSRGRAALPVAGASTPAI